MKAVKTVCTLLVFLSFFVSAKELGPDVSVYRGEELKWEDGAYGYLVMFKSLLDENGGCTKDQTEKTYTLDESLIPSDTYVERAFLIWTGAQPLDKIDGLTDSEVALSYKSSDGNIEETKVVTATGYKVSEPQGFEFDSFIESDDTGRSYFTYRVDITDFFKSIHEKGRELGVESDGDSLLGDYTVSDLDCATDQIYSETGTAVSGWAIVFVYTSYEISPRSIYIYDGFNPFQNNFSEITVHGFEFPEDPEISLSLLTYLGNPDTVSNKTGSVPEGIQITGNYIDWLFFENECNPFITDPFNYVETYNSVSSTFGWNDSNPICVSEEYGTESDTFVIDSSEFKYWNHFIKGNTAFTLRIGTNEDRIFTNTLIVSTDTKADKFDIPVNPETPDGRELSYCSCSTEKDSVCFDRPFYYLIKIQNWGDDVVEKVTLQDMLPDTVEYVLGTTEIATEFHDGKGINWKRIDDANSSFPFKNSVKVADLMGYCDKAAFECPDTVLIRFVVSPKNEITKNEIISSSAFISDAGSMFPYKTNSHVALKLKNGDCPAVTSCNLPPKSECGGDAPCCDVCSQDSDCNQGMCCNDEGICQTEPCNKPKCSSNYSVNIGKNSPSNDVVFIPARENIVLGQIAILSSEFQDCFYNFQKLAVKMDIDDKNIEITNPSLYFDRNGNGAVDYIDSQEMPFAYGSFDENSSSFEFFSSTQNFNAEYLNYIIVVADISYKEGEKISKTASFTPSIETGGITIVDDGEPEITGLPVLFSKFQLEPDNAFIITRGEKDNLLTSDLYHEHSNYADLLQFRAVSNGGNETLKSITVKLVGDDETAEFGHELGLLSIFYDENNDGTGEELMVRAEKTDSGKSHKFNVDIPFEDGVSKYFTIKSGIDFDEGDHFQIQISDIEIESDKEIFGLPVNSKEYLYECDPMYEDCSKPCCSPYPCSILFI